MLLTGVLLALSGFASIFLLPLVLVLVSPDDITVLVDVSVGIPWGITFSWYLDRAREKVANTPTRCVFAIFTGAHGFLGILTQTDVGGLWPIVGVGLHHLWATFRGSRRQPPTLSTTQ